MMPRKRGKRHSKSTQGGASQGNTLDKFLLRLDSVAPASNSSRDVSINSRNIASGFDTGLGISTVSSCPSVPNISGCKKRPPKQRSILDYLRPIAGGIELNSVITEPVVSALIVNGDILLMVNLKSLTRILLSHCPKSLLN